MLPSDFIAAYQAGGDRSLSRNQPTGNGVHNPQQRSGNHNPHQTQAMSNQVHHPSLRAQQDWPLRGSVNASNSPNKRVHMDFVSRPGNNGEVLIYHPDVPRNGNPSNYEMKVLLPTDGHLRYTSTLWASIPRQQNELLLRWEFSWNNRYSKWEVEHMPMKKRSFLNDLRKRNKGLPANQLLEQYAKTHVPSDQAPQGNGQTLVHYTSAFAQSLPPRLSHNSPLTLHGSRPPSSASFVTTASNNSGMSRQARISVSSGQIHEVVHEGPPMHMPVPQRPLPADNGQFLFSRLAEYTHPSIVQGNASSSSSAASLLAQRKQQIHQSSESQPYISPHKLSASRAAASGHVYVESTPTAKSSVGHAAYDSQLYHEIGKEWIRRRTQKPVNNNAAGLHHSHIPLHLQAGHNMGNVSAHGGPAAKSNTARPVY